MLSSERKALRAPKAGDLCPHLRINLRRFIEQLMAGLGNGDTGPLRQMLGGSGNRLFINHLFIFWLEQHGRRCDSSEI